MGNNPSHTSVEPGRKINVLHLVSSFHQGGSEAQAIRLAARLSRTGRYNIILATLRNEGRLRSMAAELGFVDPPVFPVTSFYGPGFLLEIAHFRNFVRSKHIDIVHCHDFYTNVFGIAASRSSGIRTTIASKRETSGTRTAAQSFVEKHLFRWAKSIVANSRAVSRFLITQGVTESKIDIIYNGVDISRFETDLPDRNKIMCELHLPQYPEARFVTLVANLHLEVKNQPMLLRAAAQVVARHPNTHFIFAGEGKLRNVLERQAHELNISDNVHFIGHSSRVPDLLRVSFAGVLTSNAEGFSNAILEYMAAGLPVVATDVGGAREAIVDGDSGFIVPVNDSDGLADRLNWLLDNVAAAKEMGAKGKDIVRTKFSTDDQVNAISEVYTRLIGGAA